MLEDENASSEGAQTVQVNQKCSAGRLEKWITFVTKKKKRRIFGTFLVRKCIFSYPEKLADIRVEPWYLKIIASHL